jgi:hypothetical protein
LETKLNAKLNEVPQKKEKTEKHEPAAIVNIPENYHHLYLLAQQETTLIKQSHKDQLEIQDKAYTTALNFLEKGASIATKHLNETQTTLISAMTNCSSNNKETSSNDVKSSDIKNSASSDEAKGSLRATYEDVLNESGEFSSIEVSHFAQLFQSKSPEEQQTILKQVIKSSVSTTRKQRDRGDNCDRDDRSDSRDRDHRSYSRNRDYRSDSRGRKKNRSYSRDRDHRSDSRGRKKNRSCSRDRDHRSYSRDRDHRSYSRDRDHRSYSRNQDHRSESRDWDDRSDSRDRDHRSDSRGRKKNYHDSDQNQQPRKPSSGGGLRDVMKSLF